MENIQDQIGILVKLQEIDARLYRLKQEKADKPAQKEALKAAFAEKGEALKNKQDALTSFQLKRKECEISLQTKEEEIKKYQTQLLQMKTNKEYMSMQKQIEGLKADNAVLEDDILALMEKADKAKAEIGEEKEILSGEEKKLGEETAKIDREIKDMAEKVASLEKERSGICPAVGKNLLNQYERVLKAREGLALVPVTGESCGGCHHVLPPQIISEARMKDKIISCDFCARLLYWPE
jgi:predicted  nucleic acid-binding Zn-ribbon protein